MNAIQGYNLITKHKLSVITNILASVLTLHFLAMQNTMFKLKSHPEIFQDLKKNKKHFLNQLKSSSKYSYKITKY